MFLVIRPAIGHLGYRQVTEVYHLHFCYIALLLSSLSYMLHVTSMLGLQFLYYSQVIIQPWNALLYN
jgi:hypothetical protein